MAIAERELTAPVQSPEERQGADAEWTPPPYRWTVEQFCDLGEMGLFDGQKVILIEGEILAMPAMNPPHQSGVSLTAEALRAAFGEGFFVREQAAFDVNKVTDPEPDVAVIAGGIRDFLSKHPAKAALVVEVSDSTLSYDRHEKASLYAKAGIEEYWIVNVKGAQVEVHQQPEPDATQAHGFGYRLKTVHLAGDVLQPLAASKPVAVSLLLP